MRTDGRVGCNRVSVGQRHHDRHRDRARCWHLHPKQLRIFRGLYGATTRQHEFSKSRVCLGTTASTQVPETSTITITPAVTTFLMTVTPAIEVGQLVQATGAISTQSSGAGPTGTVTFLLDGNVVSGHTPYVTPYAGTATTFADTEVVSQQFTLTSGGSPTPSRLEYSGDANLP